MSAIKKKCFNDFAEDPQVLDGAKVRIDNVLNREIEVIGARISASKYQKNKSGQCLTIQFLDPDTHEKKVVFTGSDVLINQLIKYKDELPFWATIKKIDRYYILT